MKNLLLSILLLACSAVCMAQINLREGIVITLSGDTLHGSIDYRTDQMNAEQCTFIQDGQTEPKFYRPKEIVGYRFLDNGRYYVSKTFMDNKNTARTLFLEYIVNGKLKFYQLGSSIDEDIFFIEDENGQLVKFDPVHPGTTPEVRRKNLKQVLIMTNDSKSTQKMFWEKEVNKKNVIKAVVNYNNEVCPDGTCEVFEYKKKRTPKGERLFHPFVAAGITRYEIEGKERSLSIVDKDHRSALYLSAGVDYYAIRLMKGLFGEINLTFNQVKQNFNTETYIKDRPTTMKVEYTLRDATLKLGGGYQWTNFRVQPRIQAGYSATCLWDRVKSEKEDTGFEQGKSIFHGFYTGAGVAIPLHKGALLVNGEFNVTNLKVPILDAESNPDYSIKAKRLSLSIGYQFGY